MAYGLIIMGLIMVVTGVRNTYADFGKTLVQDFTGQGNFLYWVVAIIVIGSLGYVESLRGFSRTFLSLLMIAMLLANEGFFSKLQQTLAHGPTAPNAAPEPKLGGSGSQTGDSGGLDAGKVANMASLAMMFA